MKVKELHIDFSSLSDFRRCPTLANYKHVLGYSAGDDSYAQAFGTVIHSALASYHTSKLTLHKNFAACEAEAEFLMGIDATPSLDKDCPACQTLNLIALEGAKSKIGEIVGYNMRSVNHALKLFLSYVENHGSPSNTYTFQAIEQPFVFQLTEKVWFRGTVDAIATKNATQEIVLFEHKTAYLLHDFLNKMRPNDQLTGYVYAAQKLGYNTSTVVCNGLQTAHKKLLEKPSECFARMETSRSFDEVAEWKDMFIDDAERLIANIERGKFNRNMPDACNMFNTHCSFVDICNSKAADRLNLLQANYKHTNWKGFKLVTE